MKLRLALSATLLAGLAACGEGVEFPPQTRDAYAANDAMRTDVLARCARHVAENQPFKTQSDTAECEKAKEADSQKSWNKPARHNPSKGF